MPLWVGKNRYVLEAIEYIFSILVNQPPLMCCLEKFLDISYIAGATGLRQGVSTPTKHIEYFVVTARQWVSGYPGYPLWRRLLEPLGMW